MRNVLGIIFSTNTTAALLKDGEIVACASEERFVRVKNAHCYPENAVEYCLKEGGITAEQLDLIALCGLYYDPKYLLVDHDASFSVAEKVREQKEYWYPRIYQQQEPDFLTLFGDKIVPDRAQLYEEYKGSDEDDFRIYLIQRHLGHAIPIEKFHHHYSHNYYGVYSNRNYDPQKEYLVFCIEGFGDDANASVTVHRNGQFENVYKTDQCYLGRLYRYITLLLGMKSNEHEYKVMGLAPYAAPRHYQNALDVFRQTMYVDEQGEFAYHSKPKDAYFYFRDQFIAERFDNIAGALQAYTEEVIVDWVERHIRRTGISDIVFTGGVAMNIKAMMEVGKRDSVRSLWVGPTVSDESLAIGACYFAWQERTQKQPKCLTTAYLGPRCTKGERQVFSKGRATTPQYVAELLAQGKIIARCAGRMEFGARALGNRSIMADPRNSDVVKRINQMIKSRDFWMPFAPVILKECAQDYLVNPKNIDSPYMTIGMETTSLAHEHMPAALHPSDLTARPQIVSHEDNPGYYAIIKSFQELTGVGALLNTSFNLHGEPIVCLASEAWDVFHKSSLDALILEDWIFDKEEGLPVEWAAVEAEESAGAPNHG